MKAWVKYQMKVVAVIYIHCVQLDTTIKYRLPGFIDGAFKSRHFNLGIN